MLFRALVLCILATCSATVARKCPEGTYLMHHSGDTSFCLGCPSETFMPWKEHSSSRCFHCTKIEDPTVEILIKPCDRFHDTEILCKEGYFRRQIKSPRDKPVCVNCSSACPEHYVQVHPCKNFTDIECRSDGFLTRRFWPLMCSEGHYLDTEENNCKPCPENTFMSEHSHSYTKCWDCHYKSDTDLPLHTVKTENCTSTQPPRYGCKDGFYMNYREDNVGCSPCQNCDEGMYIARPCDRYHDTVCCHNPNMTVVDTSEGELCNDKNELQIDPFVWSLGVRQGGCQSIVCFIALKKEKKKPDLRWIGQNMYKHEQFQFEEQNNDIGMTVYQNVLTICHFSADDEGEYRCRDSLWTLTLEPILTIVVACRDGTYQPPECDTNCSKHCKVSERTDVILCDHNDGACVFGCLEGYTGSMCETPLKEDDRKDSSTVDTSAIIALSITIAVLVFMVVIMCVYHRTEWCRSLGREPAPRTNQLGTQDEEQPGPSLEGETGLHQSLLIDQKNLRHHNFIPTTNTNIDHLLRRYSDNLLKIYQQATLDLSCHLSCISGDRPEGDNYVMTGTGSVCYVDRYTKWDNINCCCDDCRRPGTNIPKKMWGKVYINTASHVVHNDEEARHTKCHSPKANITLTGLKVSSGDIEGDWCRLEYITHDAELLDTFDKMWRHWRGLRHKVYIKYGSQLKGL